MRQIQVWDWPVRVLHWALAASLTGALVIGFCVDDDSPLFVYHMLCGLSAGGLVVLRLVLGVVGSRYARFQSWVWSPAAAVRYATGVLRGRTEHFVGHNPGSTWMSAGLFGAVALLIVTGLAGGGEAFEELHEVLAYAVAGLIALHLAGLVLHTWRTREAIAWSMVDGRKEGPEGAGLGSTGRLAGLAWAIAVAVLIGGVFRGYDPATGRVQLPVGGVALSLKTEDGDGERHEQEREHGHERRHGDDD